MFVNCLGTVFLSLSLLHCSTAQVCEPGQFKCISEQRCLNQSMVCDGIPDCLYNDDQTGHDDEIGCPPAACNGNDIRPLIGGASTKAGLVEVCVQNGFYQVHLQSLTVAEASVMCRQLNQGSAGFPISATQDLNLLIPDGMVTLAEVRCSGMEQSLSECTLNLIFEAENGNQAAIKCIEATDCTNGSMRLVPASLLSNSSQPSEGRLEICYLGVWGAVYDSNWSSIDAAVTCQSFGFSPKGAVPLLSVLHALDPRLLPIVYDMPQCNSIMSESILTCLTLGNRLGRLRQGTLGIRALKNVVGVQCDVFNETECVDFSIRLAFRGLSQSSGQLEICNGSVWMSVCPGSMNQSDVNVACRELGFTDYEGTNAQHKIVNLRQLLPGPTLNTQFMCNGSEFRLAECISGEVIGSCANSVINLKCLARPLIFLDPPLPLGSLTLEENRTRSLLCIADGLDFPPVTNLRFRSIENSSSFPSVRLLLNTTELTDMGTFNCTATSSGVATSSMVQIVVKGLELDGSIDVNFLRFSVSNSLRQTFNETQSEFSANLAKSVFISINADIPGQQGVICQTVLRTEEDVIRRLDRYECVILTSGGSGSSSSIFVAQSAASVMKLQFPAGFTFYNASSLGFCNAEKTAFLSGSFSWPEIEAGGIANLSCNFPFGVATRQCGLDRVWLQPNTLLCMSAEIIISTMLNKNITVETLELQLRYVGYALWITLTDRGQQTPMLLRMVSAFISSVSDLIGKNETHGVSFPVVRELVLIVNSLQQWSSNLFVETDDSSIIIMSFESIIAQYVQNLPVNQSIIIPGFDFTLVAENLPLDILQIAGRSSPFNNDETPGKVNEAVLLPSLFANIHNRTNIGLFFALYSRSTLFPIRDMITIGRESGRRTIVGSSIIGATVGPGLSFSNLLQSVEISLAIPTNIDGSVIREGSEVCVSWDFSAAGNLGNWTTEGCFRDSSSDGVVTCQCDHLTNFAVLIDICSRVQPESCKDSEEFDLALSVTTIIGVVFSVTGLVITVITLLAFKVLRVREATIYHIQLCIAIIFMLIVFVTGVDKIAVVGGCVIVSVLIHYFSLASVLWMLAVSLLMFQKMVFVFKTVTKKGIIITSISCWLAPIPPVAIPLIIDFANGREANNDLIINREKFCFLSNPIVFWLAFLGPILAIILFNSILFIIVIGVLVKYTHGTLARKNKSIDAKTVIRLMISVTGITFLFGTSWLFAALTITVEEVRKPAQVLFAIFNSLQGFFIFLFLCIFSKEARESWAQVLSFGRYKSEFLNPTLKWSKNVADMHKAPGKYPLVSHSSPEYDNAKKNSLSTNILYSESCGIGELPASNKRDGSEPEKVTELVAFVNESRAVAMYRDIDDGEDDTQVSIKQEEDDKQKKFKQEEDEISLESDEISMGEIYIVFTDDKLSD